MKMLSWLLNDYWTFPVVCYFGQVENSETSETSETSEIFFRLFLSLLFNFGPVLKIENSKEEKSEKIFRGFRRFQRFRVFNLPLFYLTFSSNRLSFFTLHRFFCFFSYFVWIWYFRLLDCHYPICKSMFKVARIKSNVYYICSKLKKGSPNWYQWQQDRV